MSQSSQSCAVPLVLIDSAAHKLTLSVARVGRAEAHSGPEPVCGLCSALLCFALKGLWVKNVQSDQLAKVSFRNGDSYVGKASRHDASVCAHFA